MALDNFKLLCAHNCDNFAVDKLELDIGNSDNNRDRIDELSDIPFAVPLCHYLQHEQDFSARSFGSCKGDVGVCICLKLLWLFETFYCRKRLNNMTDDEVAEKLKILLHFRGNGKATEKEYQDLNDVTVKSFHCTNVNQDQSYFSWWN